MFEMFYTRSAEVNTSTAVSNCAKELKVQSGNNLSLVLISTSSQHDIDEVYARSVAIWANVPVVVVECDPIRMEDDTENRESGIHILGFQLRGSLVSMYSPINKSQLYDVCLQLALGHKIERNDSSWQWIFATQACLDAKACLQGVSEINGNHHPIIGWSGFGKVKSNSINWEKTESKKGESLILVDFISFGMNQRHFSWHGYEPHQEELHRVGDSNEFGKYLFESYESNGVSVGTKASFMPLFTVYPSGQLSNLSIVFRDDWDTYKLFVEDEHWTSFHLAKFNEEMFIHRFEANLLEFSKHDFNQAPVKALMFVAPAVLPKHLRSYCKERFMSIVSEHYPDQVDKIPWLDLAATGNFGRIEGDAWISPLHTSITVVCGS